MLWFWLILFVVLAIYEGMTCNLVTIWFCIGALAAILVAWAGMPEWGQLIVFVGTSGATMFLLRPYFKKFVVPKVEKTNLDRLEGTYAVVTERVTSNSGVAKADGKLWSARTRGSHVLEVGDEGYILRIDGVMLILEPVNSNDKPQLQ